MADGGAPAWGRRGPLGCGGAAAFGGPGAFRPPGQPNKRAGPGPLAPGPALSGRAAPRRRPPWGAPSFLRPWSAPPYDRRRCAGAGEVGAVGVRGGGGVFRARRARKTKAWAGAKGPGPCFVRAVRARRPPWDAGCFPSFRARRLFFRSNFLQTKQARRSR